MLGRVAVSLDPTANEIMLDDGPRLAYSSLVIATGARGRRLPGGPYDAHVVRTLEDSHRLRSTFAAQPRLAIIGAGFIGCEVASSARTLGLDVTLIDIAPAPLSGVLGPEVGAAVARLHRAHGVQLRCGTAVRGIERDGAWQVGLADGSAVAADELVVAIGAAPACQWLAGSGLDVAQGVRCDAFGRTDRPGVYAVGDVARWWDPRYGEHLRFEHWTTATTHGDAVAGAILGTPDFELPDQPLPYFWSDQVGIKIQSFGRPKADDTVRIEAATEDGRRLVALYERDGLLTGVVGFSRAALVSRLRPLLEQAAPTDEALTALR
jgi:3-phenylpropionate/trans-cinnamate dioxygenase ferredoxin reductase subunit